MSTDDVMQCPSSYKIKPRILPCILATVVIYNLCPVWVHFSLQWPAQFRQRSTFLQTIESNLTRILLLFPRTSSSPCVGSILDSLYCLYSFQHIFQRFPFRGWTWENENNRFCFSRIEEGLTLILLEFLWRKCKQCEILISCNRR